MISDTQTMHPNASIREMCRLLRVSRATVYRRKATIKPTAMVTEKNQPKHVLGQENIFLRDEIEKIVLKHHWWGYRRVQKQLARQGLHVNRKRVLRVMQLEKLICVRKKRLTPKTTDSNHSYRCYPNLLEKHVPQGLDEVWHADLTYIRVKTDFVYLACVLLAHKTAPGGLFALDGFSRKIVGYAISSFMDSLLVLEAVQMALKARKPAPGLIHHSDRGSQYASEKYVRVLENHGVQISMSRVGVATDNAKREQPARCCLVSKKIESFFGGLKREQPVRCCLVSKKRECVNLLEFNGLEDVLVDVPAFLEEVYNLKRLHSSIGYLPPVEFEALVRAESATEQV